jgi:hypothetical protein
MDIYTVRDIEQETSNLPILRMLALFNSYLIKNQGLTPAFLPQKGRWYHKHFFKKGKKSQMSRLFFRSGVR